MAANIVPSVRLKMRMRRSSSIQRLASAPEAIHVEMQGRLTRQNPIVSAVAPAAIDPSVTSKVLVAVVAITHALGLTH